MALTKRKINNHLDKRDVALEKLIKELQERLVSYQNSLYNKIADKLADDYEFEDIIIELNDVVDKDKELISLLAWYRNEVRKINALPSEYFALFGIERDFELENPVRKYMSEFTKNTKSIRGEIKHLIAATVFAGTTRTEVKTGIKDRLLGVKKQGFVERKLLVSMRDTAIASMRAIDTRYAEKHDMDYIFYAGGRMETSRCFCVQRYDKIWSNEKVDSWNNLTWTGKIEGVNVKVAGGGYNCIHSLLPVTEEEANKFGFDESYNPC